MNRESVRRPSPASVVAVVGLALAATPIADAATGSVKSKSKAKPTPAVAHARFADNANKVNNYRASIHPTPNTLLPLGPDGRFPASVLPTGGSGGAATQGPAGPAGPAGPTGKSGLNSPGVVSIVFHANGTSADPQAGPAEATCPVGAKVLGGGFNDLTRTALDPARDGSVDEVDESEPFANADGTSGWRVRIVNVPPAGGAPATIFFQAYAICGQ
jgi:hypothetical protein